MGRIEMAERLRALHRPKDALEQVERELADHPRSVAALVELAWIRLELGESERARAAAENARSLAPRQPYVMYLQAAIAGAGGELATALAHVEEALALAPNEGAFHSYRAALSIGLGRAQDADLASARALELDPADAYTLEVRLRVLRAAWRDEQALGLARAALALHPEDPKLLVHFGELSLAAHDASAAGSAFRSALRLDPSLARAKVGLIDALRARSAVYRRLSGFLRRSERIRARMRSPRFKRGFLLYFLVAVAAGAATHDHWAGGALLLPVALLLYVVFAWFLLYLLVQVVVPIFLVPVCFDALGKQALKDASVSWWRKQHAAKSAALLALILGGCALCPPLFVPLALALPFLAARRLPAGSSRRLGYGLAIAAALCALAGIVSAWRTSFDAFAGRWILAACCAGLAILFVRARESRRSAPRP